MTGRTFDVAVIGGGPAGMAAAGAAARAGAGTALLEKGGCLGRKLALTGKGRCNLAHMERNPLKLAEAFGPGGKFLLSSLSRFGLQETLDFFGEWGIDITVERGGRVFPGEGQDSQNVIRALSDFMAQGGVRIFTGNAVSAIRARGRGFSLAAGSGVMEAKAVVVATGGLSYPETGSTGDGYRFARDFGHSIVPTAPAICPVRIEEPWCGELQGLSLKNAELSLWQGGKTISSRFGEMLFTHFGISGPIAMDMAREIGSALDRGPATLFLDLKPALDRARLDRRILRDLRDHRGEDLKNGLRDLLPRAMIPVVLRIARIPGETKSGSVTKEQRASLLEALKALAMTPAGLLGYRWAVVTSGGVSLKDLDPRTMESKKTKGLFFAGEVLDLDGPTGGYNLQACWSTGFTAGTGAAAFSRA